jgi:hypothetical protein
VSGPQSAHGKPLDGGGRLPSPAGPATPPAYQELFGVRFKGKVPPLIRRAINERTWVYCTKCGTHWDKPGFPMSVTSFHLECDGDIEECQAPLRCNQFRRQYLTKVDP